MGLEENLGKAIEGLGKSVAWVDFVVAKVNGNIITTDSYPEKFDKREYAPFDYKVGQEYSRDIWMNGEFVISQATGETYFVSQEGKPIKAECNLNDFIDKIELIGKQNKFKRLLAERKIIAQVRTKGTIDGINYLLDVALAEENDWELGQPTNPYESYSIMVNIKNGNANIVPSEYNGGPHDFYEKCKFEDAPTIKLPKIIIETAISQNIFEHITFKPLDKESMIYIRENCYHPH